MLSCTGPDGSSSSLLLCLCFLCSLFLECLLESFFFLCFDFLLFFVRLLSVSLLLESLLGLLHYTKTQQYQQLPTSDNQQKRCPAWHCMTVTCVIVLSFAVTALQLPVHPFCLQHTALSILVAVKQSLSYMLHRTWFAFFGTTVSTAIILAACVSYSSTCGSRCTALSSCHFSLSKCHLSTPAPEAG